MKKMVMAIMPRDQAESVLQALVSGGHTATFIETRGGMLRQAQMTLFIATEEETLDQVLSIINQTCRSPAVVESKESKELFAPGVAPSKPELGGAVVFIWDIQRSETY